MSHSVVRLGMNSPCSTSIWFAFLSSPSMVLSKVEAQKRHWYSRLMSIGIFSTGVCVSFSLVGFNGVSICLSYTNWDMGGKEAIRRLRL